MILLLILETHRRKASYKQVSTIQTMATKTNTAISEKVSQSILAFSNGAVLAYRFFTKEDFLLMMSDMAFEDIQRDLERFKDLEEYEICQKIKFVIREKQKTDSLDISSLIKTQNFVRI